MLIRTLQCLIGQREPVIVAGLGGEAGSIVIDDTALHEGEYKALIVREETVFDGETTGNVENMIPQTWAAGEIIHGLFTKVKLTSGNVIAVRC